MMIMILIIPLRTNLSGLYRHRRGLGFTWSRLQGRKYNIWIAKLVFHAKESPIRTRDGVLSLVSSRSNSPDEAYSPAVRIPPNPGLPHLASGSRRWEPWRLAMESEKYSCLLGETDFVESFTPSFDPKAQHINRGAGLAPNTHQETPSRVPATPSPLVYPPS